MLPSPAPQMPEASSPGPGPKLGAGARGQTPTWVAGTHFLGVITAVPRALCFQEADVRSQGWALNPGSPVGDTRV